MSASGPSGRLRVAFRVDASQTIGGGHLMRCLALADALAARGDTCLFICALLTDSLAERLRASGHDLSMIEVPPVGAPGAWDMLPLDQGEQDEDARQTLAAVGEAAVDWLVVDHYRLAARWERQLRDKASRILAIDDLANRPHDCDLLVDQTLGRGARDYRHLVPPECGLRLGPAYAMLRPEFAVARGFALQRRRTLSPPRRILLALGTTDVGGLSLPAARAVLAALPDIQIDLVVGSAAPSLVSLCDFAAVEPRLTLRVDSGEMSELIASADLGLGAAGTSAWERCCLGLPTVALILADNQRTVAAELGRAGACIVANDIGEAASHLTVLARDDRARSTMIAAAAAIVDGAGTARVSNALIGAQESQPGRAALTLRPATAEDAETAWLWRNHPVTRSSSQTTEPIAWDDHSGWWARSVASESRLILIAEVNGEPVAVVRFDRLPRPELAYDVSIYLRPDMRGGGFGGRVLEMSCADLVRLHGPAQFEASIRDDNIASRKIFERLGFRHAGALGENGFGRYVRPAEPDGAGE